MDWRTMVWNIVVALAPVFTAVLVGLLGVLVAWLHERYKWTKESRTVSTVLDMLRALVVEAEETITTKVKEAAEDGKLTKEEGKQIKQSVLLALVDLLTVEQMKVLEGVTDDLSAWLGAKVEAILAEYRHEKLVFGVGGGGQVPSGNA